MNRANAYLLLALLLATGLGCRTMAERQTRSTPPARQAVTPSALAGSTTRTDAAAAATITPTSPARAVATQPSAKLPAGAPIEMPSAPPVVTVGYHGPGTDTPPAKAPPTMRLSDQPATAMAAPSGGMNAAGCLSCPSPQIPPSQWLDAASRGFNSGSWRPPGLVGPWPRDEYVCDGGDDRRVAGRGANGQAVGLDAEDTIVQYETRDGEPRTQASNRVCIYAPRFAAVRKVYGMVQMDQRERVAGVELPLAMQRMDDHEAANTFMQPLQPSRHLGTTAASRFRRRNQSGGVANEQIAAGTIQDFLPYEDLNLIRRGTMDNSEKARLAERTAAAMHWSIRQALQVVVDNLDVAEASNQSHTSGVFRYELPDGKRRLRIVKIASRRDAKSGDIVEFTLRIDNVGDLPVDHMIISDQLSPRLEYVDKSQTCDRKHTFESEENEAGSLLLRWEIDQTLKVGEGAIIRFRCRVR